jgi:hypothetical protein
VRIIFRLVGFLLLSMGCNEVLGLDPGTPDATAGSAGEATGGALGAGGEVGMGGTNGGTTSGGAGATSGRTGGSSGPEAGRAGDDSGGRDTGGSDTGGSDTGGTVTGGRDVGGMSAGGSGGMPHGSCTTTTDCKDQGFDFPHICRRGTCIDITTDRCNVLVGAGAIQPEPEPYIIGVFMADGLESESIGRLRSYWALRLGVEEFIDQGGIVIGGERRMPLMLICTLVNSPNPVADMHGIMDHLTVTVGLPGVIMVSQPALLGNMVRYVLQDQRRDVLFIHALGANSDLENLADDGLLWHMLGAHRDLAPIYVPLVERIEEHVNPEASRTRSTRLVMIQPSIGGFSGAELAQPLADSLRINKASVADQLDVNYFQVLPYGDRELVAATIAALEPDIVVDLDVAWFYPLIDAKALERGSRLPFYVVPPYNAGNLALLAAMTDSSLRTRVVGVNAAAAEDPTMYNGYLTRARLLAPDVVSVEALENFYDPTYFLLYAAAAAGPAGELSGRMLRDGMLRLLAGEPHEIGPAEIPTILDILTRDSQSSISFHATMGAPDFDLDTGMRVVPGSVWCVTEGPNFHYDALRHNRQSGALYGTFPCFDFRFD